MLQRWQDISVKLVKLSKNIRLKPYKSKKSSMTSGSLDKFMNRGTWYGYGAQLGDRAVPKTYLKDSAATKLLSKSYLKYCMNWQASPMDGCL